MSSQSKSKPKYDFLTCLKKSKVVEDNLLEAWLRDHVGLEPYEQASQMVRDDLLTEWQAKYLLSGRYHLHLGNYQLLKRIRRDDFGDRFVALHPQLGRTVQVQVLPADLTNDPVRRAKFLKQAGLAGELDHPSLAHVFDIDRQQGRYYLVTEHVAGKLLADAKAGDFNALQVARAVRDGLAGLQHAHSRDIVHGKLSDQNVIVSDDGNIKITQLALSPLAEEEDHFPKEKVSMEQGDLLTIVRMGRKLLMNDESTPARRVLKIFTDLSSKNANLFDAGLVALDEWIRQQQAEQASATKPIIVSTARESTSTSEANRQHEDSYTPAQVERIRSPRERHRRKQSWLATNRQMIGMSLLSLLIGGIGAGSYYAYRGNNQTPKQDTVQTLSNIYAPVRADSGPSLTPKSHLKIPESASARKPTDVKPAPEPKQAANRSSTGDSTAPQKTVLSPPAPVSTKPVPQPVESPTKLLSAPTKSNPKPDASVVSATQPPPDEKQSDRVIEQEDVVAGPFDGFPNSVDLPATDSIESVVLAQIKKSSPHLLGLRIVSPEGIGKGRTNFTLLRNKLNRQQWNLLAKKTPKSKGDDVGQLNFDKASGNLKFQWFGEASGSRIANYVRNCAIKVTLGDETRTLALRRALTLPDLKLTRKKPFAQLNSAIEWLPNPEHITVELLPFKAAGLPKTWLEPAIVQPGSQAAIHFHEAMSNRFMWLQLSTNIRNKASFDLQLLLKRADGTVEPITKHENLLKLANLLAQAAVNAEREYLAKKDIVAPQGQKTKYKDYVTKLKSTASKTKRQSEIAAQNITIVSNMYDRTIPLQVMFRTDDHQVVLVDTIPLKEKKLSN